MTHVKKSAFIKSAIVHHVRYCIQIPFLFQMSIFNIQYEKHLYLHLKLPKILYVYKCLGV